MSPIFSLKPHIDGDIFLTTVQSIMPIEFFEKLVIDYIEINMIDKSKLIHYSGDSGICIIYDKMDYCVDILDDGKIKINFINLKPYIKTWNECVDFNPDDTNNSTVLIGKIMNYYYEKIAEKMTIYKHLEKIYKMICCNKILMTYIETKKFDNVEHIETEPKKLTKVGKAIFGFSLCGGISMTPKHVKYAVPMEYMTKKDIEFISMSKIQTGESVIEPLTKQMLEIGCETIKPGNPLIDGFVINNCGAPLDGYFLECYNDLLHKYDQCKRDASRLD